MPITHIQEHIDTIARHEQEFLAKWKAEHSFEQSVQMREGAEPFVFYEGPPSANGMPGFSDAETLFMTYPNDRFENPVISAQLSRLRWNAKGRRGEPLLMFAALQ